MALSTIVITPEAEAASKVALGSLYAADFISAVGASFLVSPFITIVDRSIMQNASGAMKLSDSVRAGAKELMLKPFVFVRRPEFAMVWGVYASTYMAANAIMTTCERHETRPAWPKFFGTTFVNLATCIVKDRAFARMFGTTIPGTIPAPTYLLFTVRDAATVASSFNLPSPVSAFFQDRYGMEKGSADITAQIACPAVMQCFTTPLHLLGLDYYNHPESTLAQRGAFLRSAYPPSVTARICRIGPAFGVGGAGNNSVRKYLRSLLGC